MRFFDLFQGMRSEDWVEDGHVAQHPSRRKYLPAESAQLLMATSIWSAVAPFLEQEAAISEPLPEPPNAALPAPRVSAGAARDVEVSFPETGSEYALSSGAMVSCGQLTRSRQRWGIAGGEMGCWLTQPVAAFDVGMTLASCDNFKVRKR